MIGPRVELREWHFGIFRSYLLHVAGLSRPCEKFLWEDKLVETEFLTRIKLIIKHNQQLKKLLKLNERERSSKNTINYHTVCFHFLCDLFYSYIPTRRARTILITAIILSWSIFFPTRKWNFSWVKSHENVPLGQGLVGMQLRTGHDWLGSNVAMNSEREFAGNHEKKQETEIVLPEWQRRSISSNVSALQMDGLPTQCSWLKVVNTPRRAALRPAIAGSPSRSRQPNLVRLAYHFFPCLFSLYTREKFTCTTMPTLRQNLRKNHLKITNNQLRLHFAR